MHIETVDLAVLQEILIVLGAVTIVIPIFHRIRVSPVLGFLLIGMFLGPTGLGALLRSVPGLDWLVISDRERIGGVAEFGIVLLLFMIGLELSFERLNTMRRLVFGLGPLQVLVCASAIAGAAILLNQGRFDAIVLGLAFALSSTAIIVQVLSEEKRLNTNVGRTTFAVLLFQDIAVVPILFAVTMLAGAEVGARAGQFSLALAQAAAAIGVIVVAGRVFLRPLFRSVARTGSPEMFMAASLLVLLAAAMATAAAGLSMAMGGLIAGLLLAETEYRRQIEVLIDPFKGLLLGVFLISVGMTIDLFAIAREPVLIGGLAIGLIAVKFVFCWLLVRLFNASMQTSVQAGLLLAPAGEFTLVVLGAATALGVLSDRIGDVGMIVATLTMATIPLFSKLGSALSKQMAPAKHVDAALTLPESFETAPRVIIAGFGRVGQVAAGMLKVHGVDYIAIDSDVDVVARGRKDGAPVYYGDSTNPEFLHRCGLNEARALVVTMDSGPGTERVVEVARQERPDLLIVARARDARHAAKLYAKGATDAVPETVEASLLLSETLLVDIGVPMGPVIASIHERRAQFRAEIQKLAPDAEVRVPRRVRLRDHGKTPSET
ncbi:MAG: cation:proton antiporter [Hyphomonadaceae bacterium]